jgi:hypothetical protein
MGGRHPDRDSSAARAAAGPGFAPPAGQFDFFLTSRLRERAPACCAVHGITVYVRAASFPFRVFLSFDHSSHPCRMLRLYSAY